MKRSPVKLILPISFVLASLPASHAQDLRLIIQSGFEEDTYLDPGNPSLYLRGTDHSVTGPHNVWSPLRDDVIFDIWNHDSYPDKAYYELVQDPLDPSNTVFMAELRGHNGTKGRAQGSFKFHRSPYPANVIYMTFRWLIPADWRRLGEMDPHGWTDFFEIWTHTGDESDYTVFDGGGTFRMNFRFEESGGQFIWHCKGEDRCYNGSDDREWYRYNREIPVPFGEWAEFEVLLIKGPDPREEPRSQARFMVNIRTGGGPWQTLFDVTGERTEHSYAPQNGYRAFQPVKNYTRANNIDYLIGKGLRPVFYYDDFALHVGDSYADIPGPYRYIRVPGRVEAESFHAMKGIHLRSTTDLDGGVDADSIDPGDWLAYQVNTPAGGPYAVSWRVAAGVSGAEFDVYTGDSLLSAVSLPVPAEPFDWVTLRDTLILPAGNQTLRIVCTAGEWAFNWFSLEQLGIPQVVATPVRDTLCSGDPTAIRLEGGTGTDQGVVFSYSSATSGSTLSGNGNGELQPGETISDTITNSGNSYGTVDYVITPYLLAENREPLYEGESVAAKIWVEPDPSVQSVSLKDTLESGGTTMLCLRSPVTTTAGVQIGYQSESAGGRISGHGSSYLDPGQCIGEILENLSSRRGYVSYTLIPYAMDRQGNPACSGTSVSDTVWVRPAWPVSATGRGTAEGDRLQIFPNPAGETLFFSRSTAYEVITSCGVKMVAGRGEQIDLEGLPPGIYYLKASGTIQKFVKE